MEFAQRTELRIRRKRTKTLEVYITNDVAKNLTGVRTLSAKEINHKEHKEHKETIDERFAAEASKNHEYAAAVPSRWFAGVFARRRNKRPAISQRRNQKSYWIADVSPQQKKCPLRIPRLIVPQKIDPILYYSFPHAASEPVYSSMRVCTDSS